MGVKSLWELLAPVGRPVPLETMEGKTMAIDSSIWIYQFQATMRDKEGRGLVNAHVLGFLRRITKLMFYGIKPVFVFDGGAPVLKRSTLNDRRKKKMGAAASHIKIAEKLLAAQLRRKAVDDAQTRQTGKGKGSAPTVIDDDTVYLEDVDTDMQPVRTRTPPPRDDVAPPPNPISPTKHKWHDHDPYRLPEVDMSAAVAAASGSAAPDPRLATTDELQAFIDEMKPEDFDVTSPEFRDLPTEAQYEIIGDLRLRSRQTSYKRLQQMLRAAPTPIDFSREQIKALSQRNSLTMQLLETTGIINDAHVPVRIASERSRQYTLVRSEGADGGWVLGRISDEGSFIKPIKIDITEEEEQRRARNAALDDDSDDMDMEEVVVPEAVPMDPDLRELHREDALGALARRSNVGSSSRIRGRKTLNPIESNQPLFVPEEDELAIAVDSNSEDDTDLIQVIEDSRADAEEASIRQAIEMSRRDSHRLDRSRGESSRASTSPMKPFTQITLVDDEESLYTSPTRLHTALSIGGAAPPSLRRTSGPSTSMGPPLSTIISRRQSNSGIFPSTPKAVIDQDGGFGSPTLLLSRTSSNKSSPSTGGKSSIGLHLPPSHGSPTPLTSFSKTLPLHQRSSSVTAAATFAASDDDFGQPSALLGNSRPDSSSPSLPSPHSTRTQSNTQGLLASEGSKTSNVLTAHKPRIATPSPKTPSPSLPTAEFASTIEPSPALIGNDQDDLMEEANVASSSKSPPHLDQPELAISVPRPSDLVHPTANPAGLVLTSNHAPDSESSDEDNVPWSRSPSPFDISKPAESSASSARPREPAPVADWDAAQEMDAPGEEGEFARFVAEVKGRDLKQVQAEIDEEIRVLNIQKKAAMRDSEDITGNMIAQIMTMLRLFGIPYMTAPMEAEAQCASLVELKLVDGIITDDSDVFLFGGLRVFKNMFNQSKTVECFLASDLARELGLTRDTLIRLACLLGSDYIDGLPGVGPVVAMELLKEFPGEDGLHKFRDWWLRVQTGRDKPEESKAGFRKRFKKRFRETLFLTEDWPNPAVRDAYYHPTVDGSEEPFKWGLPDLDALRTFLNNELGWKQAKVDELLLPIISKASKRGQAAALNRQGNLNDFFDVSSGSGTAVPKKAQAYASKRLQQIVSDFRKQQKDTGQVDSSTPGTSEDDTEETGEVEKPSKKRKRTKKDGGNVAGTKKSARGRGRGRGKGGAVRGGRGKQAETSSATVADSDSADDTTFKDVDVVPDRPLEKTLRPRPKPRPVGKAAQQRTANPDDSEE